MSRLTDEQVQGLRDGISLTRRLEIMAGMLTMCEPIAFGSDSAIMREAADTIHALATEVVESRAALAAKDAEIERAWRAIPARFALSPSDGGGGIDTHRAIEDMAAEIAWLLEALILITREQQSEAQAGTGEYQRGYDDCIAAHAEIARATLGRAAT